MQTSELARVPLFSGLSSDALGKVAGAVRRVFRPAGSRLFACGDPSDSFFLVESGTVRIRVPPSSVQEAREVDLGPGSFFGEMGLLRDQRRMADADVVEEARLLRVERADFEELMAVDPRIAERIAGAYKQRLEEFRPSQEAASKARQDPRRLVFFSTGGHEGASFLVAMLTVKLRELTGIDTVGVDLNLARPALPRFLGALTNFGSFSRIFESGDVTPQGIRRNAADLGSGIFLLAGTGAQSIVLGPGHVSEILPRIQEAFGYVVVDAGDGQGRLDEAVVRFADVAHVVVEPTRDSLERARPLVEALRSLGLDGRIRLIANKVPAKPEVDPGGMATELGIELLGQVGFSQLQAEREGKVVSPVIMTHPRSAVSVEITGLARNVYAQPKGALARFKDLVVWTLFGKD